MIDEIISFLNLIHNPNPLITQYQNYCNELMRLSLLVSSLKLLYKFCPELMPLELSQSIIQSNIRYPDASSSLLIQFFQSSLPVTPSLFTPPGELLLSFNNRIYTFNHSYSKNYSFYSYQIFKDLAMNDYSILHVLS